MSILTDLLEHKITFSEAAHEAEAWMAKIISGNPILTGAAGAVLSDIKQAASNAVVIADGELAMYIHPAALATETALEGALAAVTKGASLPFNPLITNSIDTIANAIKAEADVWAAKAKASLTPHTP